VTQTPREQVADILAEAITHTKWALAEKKIDAFRRHPDWKRAFKRVLDSKRFLTTFPDGTRGILDEDLFALGDATDQEFIDEIIRNGG
jgi:hypothetical protein